MVWEWLTWRCFGDAREILEEKGWEYRAVGHDDGVVPLLAESGDHCILFFERNPLTGECWFELRDKARCRVVFVQGERNVPTPQRAAELLADYGAPLGEIRAPRELPLYSLPVAPVVPVTKAGQTDGAFRCPDHQKRARQVSQDSPSAAHRIY